MKKFTLLFAAFAISVCADAQTSFDGWSKMKKDLCSKNSLKLEKPFSVTSISNSTVMSQPLNKVKGAKMASKTISREEEQLTAEAAYFSGAVLGSYYPFSMSVTMVNAAVAYGSNEVYVLPYGDMSEYFSFIAGKIEEEPNRFSEAGIDSVTFVNGQVVGGLTSGVELCIYDCDVTGSGQTGFTAVPSQAPTFGGYYVRSTGEVMIPAMVGVFAKGTTDLYTDVYMDLDVYPETYFMESIYLATASANDYFDDNKVVTSDPEYPVLAYIGNDGFYVRGGNLSAGVGNEWLSVTPASDGSSNYAVTENQYINTFGFTNKDGSKFSADCVTQPIGSDLRGKDEMLVGMSMDAQYNITLSALNGEMLGGFLYGEDFLNNESRAGYYNALSNWKVLISSDLLVNGIKGVSTESGKVAAKEYFDLSGRKVENTTKGLVIEKVRYTDGKTVSRKVVK